MTHIKIDWERFLALPPGTVIHINRTAVEQNTKPPSLYMVGVTPKIGDRQGDRMILISTKTPKVHRKFDFHAHQSKLHIWEED